MASFINKHGVEVEDFESLVLISGDADDLWESYEECFASDPYAYTVLEIRRVLHHLSSLPNEMTPMQQVQVRLLDNWVKVAGSMTDRDIPPIDER